MATLTTLFEKYRPATLDRVVGQPKAVAAVRGILSAGGFGGQSVWISGPSGTGKTTLARIIANNVAGDMGVVEYDSADVAASDLDSIEAQMHTFGFSGGRAFIINEAHSLPGRAIRRLLGMLERIPAHVVFVFTTTREGEEGLFEDQIDAGPLLSRCLTLRTTNQGFARAFAARAREIATAEQIAPGATDDDFFKLMQDCKNNARAALQRLRAGALS